MLSRSETYLATSATDLEQKKTALNTQFSASVEVPLVASAVIGAGNENQSMNLTQGNQQSASRTMTWHATGGDHNLKTK